MPGLTDLRKTLQSLKVTCDDMQYGFASIVDESLIERDKVLATFHENGRLAIIAPKDYLDSLGIENEGPYAKLTIDVHTSLELVGLTAVMATKLAEHGVSANVVAAFYHDHVFVQYELRRKAIELLENLKDS
ncbi:MAG TPA: ACT domain-containing protein [Candidatus Saccharimonadales bacterium]|nr:ACT domain-containing protein [Candidatus Saccharimonadales bacterium]